jgi:hypothetical protein
MNSKKKNIAKEPSQVYETIPNVSNEELDLVLLKLLEKAIQESKEGKVISHEEAMRRIKEKIASLK